MPITKGFRQLVDEATAQITTYSVAQVREPISTAQIGAAKNYTRFMGKFREAYYK